MVNWWKVLNLWTEAANILVSHGAFIRVLICVMAIHASPASYPNLLIDNASISILRITKKRIRLSQLNNKCYLIDERKVEL